MRPDAVQYWLEFLILNTVLDESMSGSEIERRVEQKTHRLFVASGWFAKALRRLECEGWLDVQRPRTDDPDREKIYSISVAGRARLESEQKNREASLTQFMEEGNWAAFHPQNPRLNN